MTEKQVVAVLTVVGSFTTFAFAVYNLYKVFNNNTYSVVKA